MRTFAYSCELGTSCREWPRISAYMFWLAGLPDLLRYYDLFSYLMFYLPISDYQPSTKLNVLSG